MFQSGQQGADCWEGSVAIELGLGGNLIENFRAKALAAQPADPASILYTSGTTGELKGVTLTHANLVSNVQACKDLFALGDRDVAMSFLPLCHVYDACSITPISGSVFDRLTRKAWMRCRRT